ncbi:hypothetical protein BT93_L5466 [Corymbia citriodora subsp. variegata]|uniref:Myb/SANT-like domain-containing protein n=1 Tax=Corymbia citriodora subsp. variegata TaxID=360336 RepID=A0A8T0CWT0_CORYI|nr:hypothetical protein BT93_L5466 [Corymbia citriodora subsp. variegata]
MTFQKEAFNAKWIESLTNLYISLLVEEVKKGNRTSSTYNKAGWNNIRIEFNKRTWLQYTQVQLKNKANKLKKQYGSFKKLLSQSRFGWDNMSKIFVVNDPSIWESHIKWAKFKKDGFPQYADLYIVFGDTYATGEHAAANAEDFVLLDELGTDGDDADCGRENISEHHVTEEAFTPDATPVHDKHNLDRTPSSKRRKNSHSFGIAKICKALQEMIKTRTNLSVSSFVTSEAPSPPIDPFSIFAVIDVLVSIPELEQDLYNKVVKRACNSAVWRKAFIKSPSERRNGLIRCL